ncbi:alpha/beta fold hydrolase [Pontibacter harenae]|uniref:alpha/beta fold hydrolase n=1 Tax=Pontibacter harenae TaxID=2894083 RepID=UPI001E3F0836|nr:alpha/beta hydrolase [Pontibacter harenae]MCC9167352.1 alpha/beta hydrolase [Pontibacter harenae]
MKHQLPNGLELYYEVLGKAEATQTMIFLNGLSQSTGAWAGVVYALSKKYRLVLVDLLSQGQSDAAGGLYTFEHHAADLAHFLRALQLQNTIIVGISFGGAVAQRLLVNHPELVQAGVLLSTFAQKDAYFEAVVSGWEQALRAGGYPLLLEVMLPLVLGRSYIQKPIISLENLKSSKANKSLQTYKLLEMFQTIKASQPYLEELKKVRLPVLVVQGEEDMLCAVEMGEAMAQALPNGELQVLEKAGHTLNLEKVPQLTKLLDAFAEKLKV